MRVVSLDPGGTTGYAIAYIGEPKALFFSYAQHAWREGQLWDALMKLRPDWLICESFEYRQNSRAGLDLTPAHLIGVVRLFAEKSGCKLHMQTASTGKAFYSDSTLKKFLIYNRSYAHGRDAIRHLLQWHTFGPGYQFNDLDNKDKFAYRMVEEQYLLDSYFDGIVL
jgi:hypothetical protein